MEIVGVVDQHMLDQVLAGEWLVEQEVVVDVDHVVVFVKFTDDFQVVAFERRNVEVGEVDQVSRLVGNLACWHG